MRKSFTRVVSSGCQAGWLATCLAGGLPAAAADPAPGITPGVAIGSLNRSPLSASSQYVLRSTVLEQLRSRGVPTLEVNAAPYVYLARVGIDTVDKGCVYHVTANLLPNEPDTAGERKSLWTREFNSAPINCAEVSTEMTKTLDGFAVQFSSESARGLIKDTRPVEARK